MSIKQILCVRKDLHMRLGKVAAQCSHASMKVILDQMTVDYATKGRVNRNLLTKEESPINSWLSGLFTKVVVYVNSEKELLEIYNTALESNIICAIIEDCGATEFHGIPTLTCCAIGPDESEKIDKITGNLKLL